MALPFIPSDAVMLVVQAGVVAATRPVPRIRWMQRFSGPAWALVPIGSIVVVIFAIRYVSDTAEGLTYLALVAVPLLAAVALGWAARGPSGRPALRWALSVALTAGLFALAWASKDTLWGQGAGTLLAALSCITLGVLLAAVTPPLWLKLGIILMAGADVWLVISDLLQAPNNALVAAAPAAGLPQLQSEAFGSISMGYGDLFVAALLGAAMAHQWRRQASAALLTLVLAGLFDLLFFVLDELPATVPVALALIIVEAWCFVRRPPRAGRPPPAAVLSEECRPSRPADATPQPVR